MKKLKEKDYDCTCPKCKAHLRLEMPMKVMPITMPATLPATVTVTTYVKKVVVVKD